MGKGTQIVQHSLGEQVTEPSGMEVASTPEHFKAVYEAMLVSRNEFDAKIKALEAKQKEFEKQLETEREAQQAYQRIAAQNETAHREEMMAIGLAAMEAVKERRDILRQQYDQRLATPYPEYQTLAAPLVVQAYQKTSSDHLHRPNGTMSRSKSLGGQSGIPPRFPGVGQNDHRTKTSRKSMGKFPSGQDHQERSIAKNVLSEEADNTASAVRMQPSNAENPSL